MATIGGLRASGPSGLAGIYVNNSLGKAREYFLRRMRDLSYYVLIHSPLLTINTA